MRNCQIGVLVAFRDEGISTIANPLASGAYVNPYFQVPCWPARQKIASAHPNTNLVPGLCPCKLQM